MPLFYLTILFVWFEALYKEYEAKYFSMQSEALWASIYTFEFLSNFRDYTPILMFST